MKAIGIVEAAQLKKDRDGFGPGDTVRVQVKVVEGEKERLQAFEGIVIRRRVEGVQVLRRGDVRRSKLYYLRQLVGKAARVREKRVTAVPQTIAEKED